MPLISVPRASEPVRLDGFAFCCHAPSLARVEQPCKHIRHFDGKYDGCLYNFIFEWIDSIGLRRFLDLTSPHFPRAPRLKRSARIDLRIAMMPSLGRTPLGQ